MRSKEGQRAGRIVRSRSCVLEMPSITISGMRFAIASAVFLLLSPTFSLAQSRPKSTHKTGGDRMGMTCAQILQMSSSEWIAKITGMDDSWEDGQLRGIKSYGECYDERTERLAAAVARSRKGPSAHVRRDFRELMSALDDFTAKALADSQPPGDELKKAYAALYEKEFRYEFYQSFEQKALASKHAKETATTPAPGPAPTNAHAQGTPAAGAKKGKEPVSEMTLAKNRFGELLDALPPDKMHEIHAAFGKVIELRPIASAPELAIYRYAIFVLGPPTARPGAMGHATAKPFAPPPF
jgi:hypothetical protein